MHQFFSSLQIFMEKKNLIYFQHTNIMPESKIPLNTQTIPVCLNYIIEFGYL